MKNPTTTTRLLRISEVLEITGLGRDSIYRLARAGQFPLPLKITPHSSRWRDDQVRAWIKSRPVKKPMAPVGASA